MAPSFIQRASQEDRYLYFRIPPGHTLEDLDCAAFNHLNHAGYSVESPPQLAGRISRQGLELSNGHAIPRGGRGSRATPRPRQSVEQTRTCVICRQDVNNKDLNRHEEAHYMKRQCRVCTKVVSRLDHFKEHFKPTDGQEGAGQRCIGDYRDNCLLIIHSSHWLALSENTFEGAYIVHQHNDVLDVELMDKNSPRWVKLVDNCTACYRCAQYPPPQGLVGVSQAAPQHLANADESPYGQYSASLNNMQRLMMGIPPDDSTVDPRSLAEPFAYRNPVPPVDVASTTPSSYHRPMPTPSTNTGGHQMARLASSHTSENVHAMAQVGLTDEQPNSFEPFPTGLLQFAEDQTRDMGWLGEYQPVSGAPQRDLENFTMFQLQNDPSLPTMAPQSSQHAEDDAESAWN